MHLFLWNIAIDQSVKATGGICLGFRAMNKEGHHRPPASCVMVIFITPLLGHVCRTLSSKNGVTKLHSQLLFKETYFLCNTRLSSSRQRFSHVAYEIIFFCLVLFGFLTFRSCFLLAVVQEIELEDRRQIRRSAVRSVAPLSLGKILTPELPPDISTGLWVWMLG